MSSILPVLSFLALLAAAQDLAAAHASAQDVVPSPSAPATTAPPSARASAGEEAPARGSSLYVAHAPASTTPSGELRLSFAVTPIDRVEAVIVRWHARMPGASVHEAIVGRRADGWLAEIRDDEIAPPGIVYWVVRRAPGDGDPRSREYPVFASEAEPHPVVVLEDELQAYARRSLARRGGHRYRAGASFEYVSLGQRDLPAGVGGPRAASYSKVSVEFSYAFFGVVDEIHFEAGRLFGSQEFVGVDAAVTPYDLGLNWGGGALVFRLHEFVRARSGIVFGVSKVGFELGGSLALILGDPEGTSLELGGDGITGLGGTGRLRLGWATVPHVPMGATIELTNFPTADAAGVRLLFDAAYALYPGALLRVTAGYRGWTSVVGGPSLAADLLLAF